MITRKNFIGGSLIGGASLFASHADGIVKQPKAKRILFLCTSLGFLKNKFYPKDSTENYASEYLQCFEVLQNEFTLFQGLSHEGLLGSFHQSERCFLTAAQDASSPTFKNSISFDQVLAHQIGDQTRFSSLNLSLGERGLVHNQAGVMLPAMTDAHELYKNMFIQRSVSDIEHEKHQLEMKKNVVLTSLKNRYRSTKLMDSYEDSVYRLEKSFERQSEWLDKPLPKVNENLKYEKTHDSELFKRYENFLMAIRLAFSTDSTRIATLHIPFYNQVPMIQGVDTSWHRLTHMQGKKDKLAQLVSLEKRLLIMISNFLQDLKKTPTQDGNLLDETIVVVGSNLGESNTHNPLNLPILVAGGGFSHGSMISYDQVHNQPLSRLFLSCAKQLKGADVRKFKGENKCLKEFA